MRVRSCTPLTSDVALLLLLHALVETGGHPALASAYILAESLDIGCTGTCEASPGPTGEALLSRVQGIPRPHLWQRALTHAPDTETSPLPLKRSTVPALGTIEDLLGWLWAGLSSAATRLKHSSRAANVAIRLIIAALLTAQAACEDEQGLQTDL